MPRRARVELAALAIAAAGAFLAPKLASAAPILSLRCASDALNPPTARLRLEWARACGTLVNVVSPTAPRLPAMAYLTGTTSTNGIPLWEYIETNDFWGKNSYSGDIEAVNQMFTQMQWRIGPLTAVTVAGGFQKWVGQPAQLLVHPNYPTFGSNLDINVATPLYPNPNYALLDCKLYTDAAATHVANTSVTGFYVNGYCASNDMGCADGTVEQVFLNGMIGCAGSKSFANRNTLCATGYVPATAAQWVANRSTIVPTHDYWTNDALNWSGSQAVCSAATVGGNDTCGDSVMRVCTAAGTDAEGNTCNWTHCGLNGSTDQFFGGCISNAGALCIPGP
jgi:hypothetical protein